MKSLFILFLVVLTGLLANSQVTRKTTPQSKISTTTKTSNKSTGAAAGSEAVSAKTGQSAQSSSTYSPRTAASTNTGKPSEDKTNTPGPFGVGIHPAKDAAKPFDTLRTNTVSSLQSNTNSSVNTSASNDTIHNLNTNVNNGVNTNSGAVDRSGQSQFGQTNWGRNSRNTVGESQWTVPPPITSTFKKDFPDVSGATWSRNNDSLFSARYRYGNNWSTSTYNSTGELLNTHTEIPLVQAPKPVSIYLSKQASDVRLSSIARVQAQGRADVYEIKTSTGRTIYVNIDGAETSWK